MKLSKAQVRALRLAFSFQKRGRTISTLDIAGSTGHSLWKRGLLHIHNTGDDFEGSTVSYELTDKGEQWLRDNGYMSGAYSA